MKNLFFHKKYFWLRFLIYLVCVAVIFESLVVLVHRQGWKPVLSEAGIVEDFQVSMVCLGLILALWLAYRYCSERGIYLTMGCLLLFALVRELDYTQTYKNIHLPHKAFKHLFALLVLGGICWMYASNLKHSIPAFVQRNSFLLFLLGSILVILWAQVLGQTITWKMITESYTPGKRLVEEGLEVAGYTLIVGGLIEEWLHQINATFRFSPLRDQDSIEFEAPAVQPESKLAKTGFCRLRN